MARINVEDSLFRDNRFLKLTIKTGSAPLALGLVVQAWIVAQKFYLTESQTIPLEEWKSQELSDLLIDVGLAEVLEDGVRMKGIDAQFAWLKQRVESGRKGGQARAIKREQAVASGRLAKSSKSKQTQASYSSSYSSSSSYSFSNSNSKGTENSSANAEGTPSGGPPKNPTGDFISAYVTAYQQRYGESARPHLSGKVQGQIKRYLAETPLERACALVTKYCAMQDQWFATKAHDFGTFVENQAKISLALDTGQDIPQKGGRIDWEKLGKELGVV